MDEATSPTASPAGVRPGIDIDAELCGATIEC